MIDPTESPPADAQIGDDDAEREQATITPPEPETALDGESERHPDAPPVSDMLPVPTDRHTGLVSFNSRQVEVIRNTVGKDLNDYELDFFLAQCKRLNLDPFSGQIYAWKDSGKVVTMTSIDGLRVVSERSGQYAGLIGPMWCGPDGEWQLDVNGDPRPWLHKEPPAAARVGILRRDQGEFPTWGIATFDAYGKPATTKWGKPNGMWATPGGAAHMLAKCAEAMARRTAFPNDLSGVYTDDEIPEAIEVRRVEPDEPPQPGLGDPKVEAVMARFDLLDDDAKAKIDDWWIGPYCRGKITTRRTVPKIGEGGLYGFRGSSPHVDAASDMIERGIVATGAEPTPELPPVNGEPFDDDAEVEDAEIVTPPRDPEPHEANPDWTLEERIVAVLEDIGAGTVATVAKTLKVADSRPVANAMRSMLAAGDIEYMPDAPPGPRTYQLKGDQ